MPSSHGQWFLCFDDEVPDPVAAASDLFGKMTLKQVAMTDQSDAWVILALTGPLVYRTLERICPIDCSSPAMPIGTTARTIIEHLGTIILRRPDDDNGESMFLAYVCSVIRSQLFACCHCVTSFYPSMKCQFFIPEVFFPFASLRLLRYHLRQSDLRA